MKITALKVVYWYDGFVTKKGKVKTVSEHHAEVQGEDGFIHLVAVKELSTVPFTKQASGNGKIIISE